MKQSKPRPAFVPKLAMKAADAFRADAFHFFGSLPNDTKAAADYAVERIGSVFAASTELSLSLELYLKTLLVVLSGDGAPETHDLVTLFEALPEDARREITGAYEARVHTGSARILALGFQIGPEPNAPVERAGLSRPIPLVDLLEANRTAFVKWRYMHEVTRGVTVRHDLDFYEIDVLCECTREEIVKRKPSVEG